MKVPEPAAKAHIHNLKAVDLAQVTQVLFNSPYYEPGPASARIWVIATLVALDRAGYRVSPKPKEKPDGNRSPRGF